MQKKENIRIDLKSRFEYLELEEGIAFEAKELGKYNHIFFILSGEMKVIYGDMYPRSISGGTMILLTPISNCVCRVVTPVRGVMLGFDQLINHCDHFIFQSLTPIYSLLKYEFKELEIRPPVDQYLNFLIDCIQDRVSASDWFPLKMRELFILLRAYYNIEELAMFFYPLLGKNIEFKRMVTDNYLRVKNASEYAELCGYSLGVFQRKFKDVFGETVYQWMQRQKAEQIKHYLMTTDINLKDLAEELDFASPAHLNKFCKVWFGMTPSEVRQTFMLKKKLR